VSAQRPLGVVGVFATADALMAAARRLRSVGIRVVEAHTPYPVDGLDELLRPGRRTWLPPAMAMGALFGAVWGYFIQYWDEALNYPINVGGRPHNSWPAFTVGTFEFCLLCAIAAGFFALLATCRLPLLYHPIDAATAFERASVDRFILFISAADPGFDPQLLRRILARHGAEQVAEVPA
jgi:Alternative complex III, ActD subunit